MRRERRASASSKRATRTSLLLSNPMRARTPRRLTSTQTLHRPWLHRPWFCADARLVGPAILERDELLLDIARQRLDGSGARLQKRLQPGRAGGGADARPD